MNANKIIGMKIIDKNARDLGKVAELKFNIETFNLENVYGSIGNPINKKYYSIPCNSIQTLGDYLQLSETKESLEENTVDKILDDEKNIKVNELVGKTVLNKNGNECGKVTNVNIDFDELSIENIEVSTSSSFGMNKISSTMNKSDINGIGDYVIINKELIVEEKEETNDKETENKEEMKDIDIK